MKRKKYIKRIIGVVGSLLAIYGVLFIVNIICNIRLRHYINTFDAVQYEKEQLVPQKEEGYYAFRTDEPFDMMYLTDIHMGGGFWTYKQDKKTIYEVITMLQAEKPDLVILGGDNTYAVPGIGINGGFTFNNKMVAKTLIHLFEHEQVYYSTVFGNHDTEAFDYYDRQAIGNLYMDHQYTYCIFEQDFTDLEARTVPSVSNQCILIKNSSGAITKVLMLIDSNAYVDTSIISSIQGKYDTIHEAQVDWAAEVIKNLSAKENLPKGEYLKSFFFMHIPIGEYRAALDDLFNEVRDDKGKMVAYEQKTPKDTQFIEGAWGEEKVCYGGISDEGKPEDQDQLFETLAIDMKSMEAVFCGHDHVNSAVVNYKGVMLAYGYSVDNIAYLKGIESSGTQRGATAITIMPDGSFNQVHKNAYIDYGCDLNKFYPVYLDHVLWPEQYRTVQ